MSIPSCLHTMKLTEYHLHANEYLIRDVLRKELGFKGYVFSDYEAIWMLEGFHKITANKSETALSAINAGIDLEAPT